MKLMTKKMGRSFTFLQCLWLASQVDLFESVRTQDVKAGRKHAISGHSQVMVDDRAVELSTLT
jgi:hypothetical protein